jgi:uncharacterized membrane protein
MKAQLVAFASTFVIFVVIDFIWLGSMANVLYRPALGDMLAPDFRLAPAVFFYFIFVGALCFFAVWPALAPGRGITTALLYGGIFGFAAYATYDLTNQATLRNWSTLLTVVDLAWGSALSATAAAGGYWITRAVVE